MFYMANSFGADVGLKQHDFNIFCGRLFKESDEFFDYYRTKLARKIRFMYRQYKIEWDGYYYFALHKKQYEEYLAQVNKRGRKRKYFEFNNIMLYKIKDELYVSQLGEIAIFRMPITIVRGEKWFLPYIKTDKAEFICMRPTLTFKDVSTLEHKYDFIKCRSQKTPLPTDQ